MHFYTAQSDAIKCRILIALGNASTSLYTGAKRLEILAAANVSEEDGDLALRELNTARALSFDDRRDMVCLQYTSNKKRVSEAVACTRKREYASWSHASPAHLSGPPG